MHIQKTISYCIIGAFLLFFAVMLYALRAQMLVISIVFVSLTGVVLLGAIAFFGALGYVHIRKLWIASSVIHVTEHGTHLFGNGTAHELAPAGRWYPGTAAPLAIAGPSSGVIDAEPNSPLLPTAPAFASMVDTITSDQRMILGYGMYGPVYGTILDLLSTNVVGKPGKGKSTALYFFLAQLMCVGAQSQVFDPHGVLAELASVSPYEHDLDAMSRIVPRILYEMGQRKLRLIANGGKCLDPHFLFIVDELPAIALWEQQQRKNRQQFHSILDLIQIIILEGRKFHMYCVISGQSMPASVLPTLGRDSLSSHYVFASTNSHARMAGLERDAIVRLLPLIKKATGVCILDAASRSDPEIVAIPYTTVEDVYRVAHRQLPQPSSYTPQTSFWDTGEDAAVRPDDSFLDDDEMPVNAPVNSVPARSENPGNSRSSWNGPQNSVHTVPAVPEQQESAEKTPESLVSQNSRNGMNAVLETVPGIGPVPVDEVNEIRRLAALPGMARRRIAPTMGKSNGYYSTVKAVCDMYRLLVGEPSAKPFAVWDAPTKPQEPIRLGPPPDHVLVEEYIRQTGEHNVV